MKKILAILLMCLIFPVTSWAYRNEPQGFENMAWGESLEALQARNYKFTFSYSYSDTSIYALDSENFKIAGNKPVSITCNFLNNQLFHVSIVLEKDTSDYQNKFKVIYDSMVSSYGQPSIKDSKGTLWSGKRTNILLDKRVSPQNKSVGDIILSFDAIGLRLENHRKPSVISSNNSSINSNSSSDKPSSNTADKNYTTTLTYEKYDRIKAGMSYSTVVEIIGAHGKETQRTEMYNITNATYQWKEDLQPHGYRLIIVMFRNDKVVSKSQSGL